MKLQPQILLLLALLAVQTVAANTLTVLNNNDNGAGSLRQAIANAASGDTINFDPGVTGTITLASELGINKNLVISGPGANVLMLSGNNACRIFNISAGSVVISGLTVANGNASIYGGSTIADGGGGIYNSATLLLDHCTVSGNMGGAPPTTGGAINNTGALMVNACAICRNTNPNSGGGISSTGPNTTVTVIDSTFYGNSALNSGTGGGAIFCGGSLFVSSSTFSGNSAEYVGGGIATYLYGTATIQNTIIAGNSANSSGRSDADVGLVNSLGHNLIGKSFPGQGWISTDLTGTDALPLNPKLGPLQYNGGATPTMALLTGSPAIDQGTSAGVQTLDQQQTTGANSAGSLDQWQSFTAGQSGPLTKIALSVSSPVAPANSPGTIYIYAGEGASGALLASTPVTFVAAHGFQTFTLPTPPLVTAGKQYTIRFSVPAVTVGWVDVNISNPYGGGRASADPSWDYVFKTYVALDQRGWQRSFDFPGIANASGGDGSDIGAFELSAPVLDIAVSGGNAVLSWSTNYPGYELESTPSLNPTAWTVVPGNPTISGGQYVLPAGAAAGKKFFRLIYVPAGIALSFNGTANCVRTGASPISPPWTAEFWVNRQDAPTFSAYLLSDNNTALKLEQYNFTRKVGFTQFGVTDYLFNYTAPDNTWVHLAFVCDSSTRLYVNGVLQDSNPATINLPLNLIGDYLNGQLDEVRAWNVARTPVQIQANMNHALSAPQANLIGYWKFDEGSGTAVSDSSGQGRNGLLQNGPAWVTSTAPLVP